MIFVVYVTEGVIGFVSHELNTLLEYITRNKYHSIEVWNGNRRRAAHW
jgi:hypothetical protein